ncbi:MAG TPA: N-acetylmuramoyl-L-alanine amidase [Bacillota bacterium]|nr:N-acetylmuramoyl-L-alanine amidase [Bacillota bacterium]
MKRIVIDPGHGGRDPGAVTNGLQEKDLTLDIARRTRDILNAYQAEVRLTRDDDIDLDLSPRADMANSLNADYFCSIHVNAGGGTGFESYVYTLAGDKSQALRGIVHDQLSEFYRSVGFPDRGKKKANFAVLRQTNMPAVLLENLFIDRKEDAAKLAEPSFRQGIAEAIAAGLARALELQPAAESAGVALNTTCTVEKVTVLVRGKNIQGFITNDRTYAPVRDIAEALGYRVTWYEKDKIVYIQ